MNSKKYSFISGALLLVLVLIGGCDQQVLLDAGGNPVDGPIEGFALSGVIWTNPVIPVCWENPGNDAEERAWVREAIAGTWEAYSAVRFVGWGVCHEQSRGIRIMIEDGYLYQGEIIGPHVKSLGSAIDGMEEGMSLNFTFNNWHQACQIRQRDCIQSIAVHEFGHALGFAHEQNRDDIPPHLEEFCTEPPQGPNGNIYVTPWDMDSVMNYCNPEYNGNGVLSVGDIATVQRYYARRVLLENGIRTLENNPRCVTVEGNQANFDTDIIVAECDGGIGQNFRYDAFEGFIRMESAADMCLDVAGANYANGTNVHLWECNGNDAQRFDYYPATREFRVRNHPEYCLDFFGGANGNSLQIWQCHGVEEAIQQQFNTGIIQASFGTMAKGVDPMCVDIAGGGNENETNIHIWSCYDTNAQRFEYDPVSGTIKRASHPNKCLDVGGEFQNNTTIYLWDCNGGPHQSFDYEMHTGRFRLRADNRYCIEKFDPVFSVQGDDVLLWQCHDDLNQKFLPIEVPEDE